MDGVAGYGEACTTPDTDIHIVRSANTAERALLRADGEKAGKILLSSTCMTFDGDLIPEIYLRGKLFEANNLFRLNFYEP